MILQLIVKYVPALATLFFLEVVLGVDNVIFISLMANKLPVHQQKKGRELGIIMAVVSRSVLLLSIAWIIGLKTPWLSVLGHSFSGKDFILIFGGAVLMGKSTWEIHEMFDPIEELHTTKRKHLSLFSMVVQVVFIDIIFSLDSVFTAVGVSRDIPVMILAISLAAVVMVFASGKISRFVEQHPSMKTLALAFLILIGVILVIEGWNSQMAEELRLKNYVYFAMAFSLVLESINMRLRGGHSVKLHKKN